MKTAKGKLPTGLEFTGPSMVLIAVIWVAAVYLLAGCAAWNQFNDLGNPGKNRAGDELQPLDRSRSETMKSQLALFIFAAAVFSPAQSGTRKA